MEEVQIGKLYKHYKGNLYKVVCIAKHSETLEEMVIYSSVCDDKIWTRPKKMWNNVIDNNGTLRFTLAE